MGRTRSPSPRGRSRSTSRHRSCSSRSDSSRRGRSSSVRRAVSRSRSASRARDRKRWRSPSRSYSSRYRRRDRSRGSRSRRSHRHRSNSRDRSRSRSHSRRRRLEPLSLLVRNLAPSTTESDIRQAFSRDDGDIRDVYIPKEFGGVTPKGFAFVEFADAHRGREAKYRLDRTWFNGREIAVLFAQQRRKTPQQMRELEQKPFKNSPDHHYS